MKPPSSKSPRRLSPAELEAMTRRDRNKLFLLTAAALLLAFGYFYARWRQAQYEDEEAKSTPAVDLPSQPEGEVLTLPFDDGEVLATIEDATPEQRLTTSDEALTALLYYSTTLAPRNYEALGVSPLDPALVAEIAAAPDEHRVAPLRARGRLEKIGKRRRDPSKPEFEEHYGTLALEGGDAWAHVAFLAPPEDGLAEGDWVRLDGVFVQMLRAEAGGVVREGPLLAGRSIVRSVPPCTAMETNALRAELMRQVEDDSLEAVSGVPFEPLWELMAFAQQRVDEADWESALELDDEKLRTLLQGGEAFRGVPFRLPTSVNMGTWTELADENCLRQERVTQGWIGNFTWKSGLVKWIAPFDRPELADRYGSAHYLTARGFFLKNVYYEQANGDPGKAPLFVMAAVDSFAPPVDPRPQQIMWMVLGGTLVMIALIWWLLRRDRRASARLQAELVRRRRARRERTGSGAEQQPSPEST